MENTSPETERLEILFQKFYLDTATQDEIAELAELLAKYGEPGLSPVLKQAWLNENPTEIFSKEQSDAVFSRILSHGLTEAEQPLIADHKVRPLTSYKRIAIAAAIAGIIILGYFALNPGAKKAPAVIAKTDSVVQDISPGKSGGVLTLSNGQEILLDDRGNGTVANEGQVKVVKKDGQLTYEGENAEGTFLNTLRTPRGRQYNLVLADGSKVWLNASSSISYPANFSNNERVIEITGEAYFEIASDRSKPFKVKLYDGSMVNVTGTHFNVNSYLDEKVIKTTLLEGGVQVTRGNERVQLKPGQQAIALVNSLKLISNANLEEVMAWKNGFFSFQNVELKSMMRQISRWYDVDVIYEGDVPEVSFSGEIGRSLTLKQVLSILDETRIHYKLVDKKLIITR